MLKGVGAYKKENEKIMTRKRVKMLIRFLIAAGLLIVVAICAIFLMKNKIDEYKKQANKLQSEIAANTQTVYVVRNDRFDADGNMIGIKAGDIITDIGDNANVMLQTIYTGLDAGAYITAENIGDTALIDIKPEEPVMTNMVTKLEITQDMREYEISVADLMVDQQPNDYIDVRIMFPTGDDYLVLSKKQVKNLVLNSSLFYTHMSEEEILRLASATIDAYTITGTKIYVTRYVEGNIQQAGTPDYLVKQETLDRLAKDPNVLTLAQNTMNLQARMSLESRLASLTEEQLKAVNDGHGLTDTAKQSVLTKGNVTLMDAPVDTEFTADTENLDTYSNDEEQEAIQTEKEEALSDLTSQALKERTTNTTSNSASTSASTGN